MNILKLFRRIGLDVRFSFRTIGKRYVATAGRENDLDFGAPEAMDWFTNKRDAYQWAVSALEEVLESYAEGEAQADVYDLWLDKYVYRITATVHEEKVQHFIHFEVIQD